MINNFRSHNYKSYGVKLDKGDELQFRFDYVNDPGISEETFLSNLHMTSDTFSIETDVNLNWNINDVVLIGKEERTRYQIINISKKPKTLSKNFYGTKLQWSYILTLGA